ncbi:MAG TPA: MMPL family transporter [Acetobacteraceae bacterium]|nr:MMPL family transporter [Acetobacteraceae bacterium]
MTAFQREGATKAETKDGPVLSRPRGSRAIWLRSLLVAVVDVCHRRAVPVVGLCVVLAGLALFYASGHLGVTTDTTQMFAPSLPWRQAQARLDKDFPQFSDQLVMVIDARVPEEAQETAAALADKLKADPALFRSVTRPDASPFFTKEGLLYLDSDRLTKLMNSLLSAQPFLGQLVSDPSARGLFSALGLIGMGVAHGQADLAPYDSVLRGFASTIQSALAGQPQPLSWQNLLGGGTQDLAGKYLFVLAQPTLNYGALQPGGEAVAAIRQAAAELPWVKAGDARVRITGSVALSDEEFASVAEGIIWQLVGSLILITLWLYLAVASWRLIVPILLTLLFGLSLTVFFAAAAVGTLNLISIGFGVLFVGIAVDFAIQFSVRYRERRYELKELPEALRRTAARAGIQILIASVATAAGFLAFVPTAFIGVAELGLIAGVGMLIAFACTMTFLPAAITLFRPKGEEAEVAFRWARRADAWVVVRRRPILVVFAAAGIAAMVLSPHLAFDSNPLHTKNQNTEAMRTLQDLISSPITNPYTIDVMEPSAAQAAEVAEKLRALPSVLSVRSIASFIPDDQQKKIAIIQDAEQILEPTLTAPPASSPPTPDQIRLAAKAALQQIEPTLAKAASASDSALAVTAAALRGVVSASDAQVMALNTALTRFLGPELDQLRASLSPAPVTLASLPESIKRDWLLPDGEARVQVVPKAITGKTGKVLSTFVAQVRSVAPNAGGPAVTIVKTSDTIMTSFRNAATYALAAIAAILLIALWSVRDAALVMAPLLISGLLTLLLMVVIPLPLNYANIIALPLLLGVGVAFNIYFVMNWREGRRSVLASPTARAILFSALTTGTAFGSLALSAHPGTASMGDLLLISLGCTLLGSLVFIPALLASVRPK